MNKDIIEFNETHFHFFWDGVFSQWHPSTFRLYGENFVCAEQWMMYTKALTFGDEESMQLILKEPSPRIQKELGRKIRNFNPDVWSRVAQTFVYQGNYAKFTQNPKLLDKLMQTKNKTLVEASPLDTIWGIGLDKYHAESTHYTQWKGQNLLGKTLTRLKYDLKELNPYKVKYSHYFYPNLESTNLFA